ncbi:biotin--[acetyl-CoA-carboxylase] ligase [Cognatishimia sp. F0-27]|uniref:biotin--[acetyl-CoA-carboxylase] ligase n=1 Tax=Cognatishimia sp. F0-27 TaxID=2816855 RepID=UPI001D0C97B5|nr:biotin--[acetyl-CoA-carboxylase] ligase [Cognatishimia sp. F0-27]MCC1492323.1 biotin--[acetyl-CoA-carboxylase] ligase [Cognatishimia sp. F0-27]
MTWPVGYGRVVLASVDSTQAEAARRFARFAGPEWILARSQTAARGRRGRPWLAPAGNFAASLVLRPDGEAPERVALRSFVAALALHEAFEHVGVPRSALALKWPNDVLLNEGKVAGILLEAMQGAGGGLAIGVGVNLIAAPDPEAVETGAVQPVSLLEETGIRVAPEPFLDALAAAYAAWEARFVTYGFEPVRAAWLDRAARIGAPVTARMGHQTLSGIFETVDPQGALVLQTDAGRRAVTAADIFF